MKLNLNKRKCVLAVLVVAALGVATLVVVKRGKQFVGCIASEYDLRRDTNFRFATGRCTATGKDGSQVYVDQLRAFGDTSHHDTDVDHGN